MRGDKVQELEAGFGENQEVVRPTAASLINDKHHEPASNLLVAGRQLDALIAERLFGATWEDLSETPPYQEMAARLIAPAPNDWIQAVRNKDGSTWFPASKAVLPEYSTSIADAWLVVEKIAPNHLLVNLNTLPGGFWRACFFDLDEDDNANAYGEASAMTAPLAICLAALKSLEFSAVGDTEGAQ